MILEGALIVIACTALTIFHPGFAFRGKWHEADFKLKSQKMAAVQTGKSGKSEAEHRNKEGFELSSVSSVLDVPV